MTEKMFDFDADDIRHFLEIYKDKQAWINLAYLFLMFPLGIAYFVFLVTGMALGMGLVITLVGIPLLLGVFYLSDWLVQFEAWLAEKMIGANIPYVARESVDGDWLTKIIAGLKDVKRWKGVIYLLLRFPLGIVSFVIATTVSAFSFSMIAAPVIYQSSDLTIFFWHVNIFGESLLASILGVFVGAIALNIVSGIVALWRAVIVAMLGDFETERKLKNEEKAKRHDEMAV